MKWAAATLVLLLLPTASAFDVQAPISVTGMEPGVGGVDMEVTFTASCQEVWDRRPPATGNQLVIAVAPSSSKSGLEITGPNNVVLTTDGCQTPQSDPASIAATYTVAATRDAPGLEPIAAQLSATLEGGDQGETITYTHDFVAVVEYYELLQVQANEPILTASPGEQLTFTLTFTNNGNARTTASLSLAEDPASGTTVLLPQDVIVDDRFGADVNTQTSEIAIRAPNDSVGWANELIAIDVIVETWATDDPERKGDTYTVSLLLRNRGIDTVGSPNVTPAVSMLGLLGAGLLARRRS